MSEPSVVIAVHRLSSALLTEVRAACKTARLAADDWEGGTPRAVPSLIITALEPGERRLPIDVVTVMDSAPGIRAIVCASEPLVKPRIALAGGRVVLLGPPVDRFRLAAVMRAALGEDLFGPGGPGGPGGQRFEALRRLYWVAWVRGQRSSPVNLDEQRGLTVSFGAPEALTGIARLVASDLADEAELAALGAEGGFVHLADDCTRWVMYWPDLDRPLWLCSPHRLPGCWEIQHAMAASPDRLVRLTAFPGDQVMAAWATDQLAGGDLAALKHVAREGGSETLGGLAALVEAQPGLASAVVEVR
jgi:hypothetical protein